jgi:hypothetical protein
MVKQIPHLFEEASGLRTNMEKTEFYPIRCHELNMADILEDDIQSSEFPCSYLGLSLYFRKLPISAFYLLIQRIGNRLPRLKRGLMSYPGRELLVKTVLLFMPTYFLTFHKLLAWAAKDIDRYRRSLLWRGEDPDRVSGGHCLVKWKFCTRLKRLGVWGSRIWINSEGRSDYAGFGTIGTSWTGHGRSC